VKARRILISIVRRNLVLLIFFTEKRLTNDYTHAVAFKEFFTIIKKIDENKRQMN